MSESSALPLPPDLPAAQLANLSLSQDRKVRAAVASHPNTAPFLLGTLAAEFPHEVLNNPALPLLRLADPLLTHRWPDVGLLALVKQAQAPAWVRKQALTHPGVELQLALASHPGISREEEQALARHESWLVRARLATREDLPSPLLEALAEDAHYAVRLAVASRTNLPGACIQNFLTDASRFVRQEARRQAQRHRHSPARP